jgi:hypothetical protein
MVRELTLGHLQIDFDGYSVSVTAVAAGIGDQQTHILNKRLLNNLSRKALTETILRPSKPGG